jgi:hypothetical protein
LVATQKKDTTMRVMLILIFLIPGIISAQEKKVTRKDWKYVPINLDDAIHRLDYLISDSNKLSFKETEEPRAVNYANMGPWGTWIRNDWKLWKGSRLNSYFDSLGIHHPEEMTNVIFTSFHRHLNNRPIDLNGQIALIVDFHKNPQKYLKKPVERFAIGDTVSRSELEPVGFPRDILGLHGWYELIGIIQEKDFDNDKVKIKITEIKPSKPDIKIEKEHYVGAEIWYDATWWRKKGEMIHIDITPQGTSVNIVK